MIRFRLFSISFAVSFWAVLLVSFALITSVNGQMYIIICLFCTVFHEFGHLLMICKYKGKPESIAINPFEIRINADLSELLLKEEVCIISFGVVFNFLLGILTGIFYWLFSCELFLHISISSLCVGVVNLLPLDSFDGGQLLKLLLSRMLSQSAVSRILSVISIIFIIPLVIIGIAVLFVSQYNFSVLFIALFLISIYISKELR